LALGANNPGLAGKTPQGGGFFYHHQKTYELLTFFSPENPKNNKYSM